MTASDRTRAIRTEAAWQRRPARMGGLSLAARERLFALACFLPCVALVALLILYPFAYTFYLSLHRRQLFAPQGVYIGLDNFTFLLQSRSFWQSLVNGVVFAGGSIALQVVLGVALALLLNRRFPGQAFFRGALLFPYLIPSVVGIFTIRWMLNDLYGIVNHWLQSLGLITQALPWLGHPRLAMASLIGINTWMFYPFVMLCVLARLQSIPRELYEAARIDGAGAFAQFRYITLPQIRGTLVVVVLVRALWMFNKFDTVWLTTQGGPFGSTQTLPVLAYVQAFNLYELGRGSAVGVLLSALLFAIFLAYRRLFMRVRQWQ
jgi:multiple sugar transport system permease protein